MNPAHNTPQTVENFSHPGAGSGQHDMSRTRYDAAYVALYKRLAENAYNQKLPKTRQWDNPC